LIADGRKTAWSLISTLAILLFLVLPGVSSGAEIDVDSAIALALERNKTYLQAMQEKVRAEGEIREAWAGALPTLTFEGAYTRNLELPEVVFQDQRFRIGTTNNYRLGFTLDQTLFGGGRVFNALVAARLYDRYATEAVKLARVQVIYGTREYFFSVILARDNVAVYKDAVRTAEENFQVVKSQYEHGLVSEYDKLRAEVELANLMPQLTSARNNANIVLRNFRYFIGYTGREELEIRFDFDIKDTIPTPSMEESVAQALEQRPDYVGQDYLIRAIEKGIGIARSGRLPSLYFSAALNWEASIDDMWPGGSDWIRSSSVSLNLNFPIFDGLESSGKVKKAKADYIQGSLEKQKIEDAIRVEVEEAIGSIMEAKKRLASGEKTIVLAEEGLRVANLRFKNGIGTQLEILSALQALTQARTNYIQAIHDYQVSLAKYDKAVGFDLPDIRRK
jgi:outer membrane protein TolC